MILSPQPDTTWSPYTLPRATTCLVTAAANGHRYRLSISVPDSPPPEAGYPMLLVLDGGALFPTVAETERRLSHRTEATGVEPMVIVGVGPGDTDLYDIVQRHRDFTPGPPARPEDAGSGDTGGATAFLSFLLDQVLPTASDAAKIDRDRVSLFGHSLAGYFILDALSRQPDAFHAWCAISPSIWWDPARLHAALARMGPISSRVFLGVGRREQISGQSEGRRAQRRMVDAVQEIGEALRSHAPADRVELCVFADEDHASVVSVATVRALRIASAS